MKHMFGPKPNAAPAVVHEPPTAAEPVPVPAPVQPPAVTSGPDVRKNPLDCPECGKMINHAGPHGVA